MKEDSGERQKLPIKTEDVSISNAFTGNYIAVVLNLLNRSLYYEQTHRMY